jgi:hypothetical protein
VNPDFQTKVYGGNRLKYLPVNRSFHVQRINLRVKTIHFELKRNKQNKELFKIKPTASALSPEIMALLFSSFQEVYLDL